MKEGVGGLRDLHAVLWVGHARFGSRGLPGLEAAGLLDAADYAALRQAYDFLCRVRNEAHFATGRKTDLLTLDLQADLAHNLGYKPAGRAAGLRDLHAGLLPSRLPSSTRSAAPSWGAPEPPRGASFPGLRLGAGRPARLRGARRRAAPQAGGHAAQRLRDHRGLRDGPGRRGSLSRELRALLRDRAASLAGPSGLRARRGRPSSGS